MVYITPQVREGMVRENVTGEAQYHTHMQAGEEGQGGEYAHEGWSV